MRTVDLLRLPTRKGIATFGVLSLEGVPQILTLEPPDLNNTPNKSCIPVGTYTCAKIVSKKVSGPTFILESVPGRSGILFHHGNTSKDTEGCILTGSEFMFVNGEYGIGESKKAFLKFMELVGSLNRFQLCIRQA